MVTGADRASKRSVLARYPDFRRLFVANSLSLLGSSVTTVALPLTAVVYLHASPVQMGFLGAVALLPHLVLGLPAGVWVDRLPYKRILVLADLAQTALLGSIPVLAVFGSLRIWQLYVVVVLAGAANLFEIVTAQSFTPVLVPRRQLLAANSTLMLSYATVNTSGSAVGGVLVSLLTAPIAIAVDAVSFLFAGLCKARIHANGPTAIAPRRRGRPADIIDDLRAVFTHPVLRVVTLAATVGAFANQLQNVVLVLYLVRDLGLSAGLVGLIVAIGGAGGVVGALLATRITWRIGPGPAFIIGMFLAATAGLVLAAAAGPLPLALVVLAVAQILRGWGPSLFGVNQQTFRQALTAPALLSRAKRHLAVPRLRRPGHRRAARWVARLDAQPAGHPDRRQCGDAGRYRDRLPLPTPFVARAARRARQGMTCPPAVTAEPTGRLTA
jgi:MFS family permease